MRHTLPTFASGSLLDSHEACLLPQCSGLVTIQLCFTRFHCLPVSDILREFREIYTRPLFDSDPRQ